MATVDLPEPDSPTTPSRWPGRIVNDRPSTARTTVLLEREVDDEVVDREDDVAEVCHRLDLPRGRVLAHEAALPAVVPPAVMGVLPGVSTAAAAPALPLRCTATSMPSLMST